MKTQAQKTNEKQLPTQRAEQQASTGGTATIEDNRPRSVYQRKLQRMMNASNDDENNPIQRKPNNTGLPGNLKTGIENLSGYSMDDVKVHYNSSKPAQLQAHAYAQGTNIHLAPGQEKHLPHEAWHVVQQKQGRVRPTMQFKGKVNINDDAGLEREADVMGDKATSTVFLSSAKKSLSTTTSSGFIVQAQWRKKKKKPKQYSKDELLTKLTSFGMFSRPHKANKELIENILTTVFKDFGLSFLAAKKIKALLIKMSLKDLQILEQSDWNNLIGTNASVEEIGKIFSSLTGMQLLEQEVGKNGQEELDKNTLDVNVFNELFSFDNVLGLMLLSHDDRFYRTIGELPQTLNQNNIEELENIGKELEGKDPKKKKLDEIIGDIRRNGTEWSLLQLNIALRRVNSPNENIIEKLVNSLPDTEEALDAIEKLEDELITNSYDVGLTINLHKIFHIKKTAILETLIENLINGSDASSLIKPLQNIRRENYWKMLIDGKVHERNDKHFYDRSKGFMASMMKGLYKMMKEAGTELSVDYLIELHDIATSKVTKEGIKGNIIDDEIGQTAYIGKEWKEIIEIRKRPLFLNANFFQKPGIKGQGNGWGVNNGTPKGREELEELMTDLDKQLDDSYFFKDAEYWKTGRGYNMEKTTRKLLQYSIERYNDEIKNAKTNDERLGAIIDCCRRLGVIHPFEDANGRTIQILLLNKLLIDNGFAPTSLYMQDFMIGRPKKELVKLIKQGQKYLAGKVSKLNSGKKGRFDHLFQWDFGFTRLWQWAKSYLGYENEEENEDRNVVQGMEEFQRLSNPGDGDCLFHSVSQLLQPHFGQNVTPSRLRMEVASFYRRRADAWSIISGGGSSVVTGNNRIPSLKKYIKFIRKKRSWATDSEVGALSALYGIDICIVQPGNQYHEVFTGFGERTFLKVDELINRPNTIFIYHQRNLHFEAFVRRSDEKNTR